MPNKIISLHSNFSIKATDMDEDKEKPLIIKGFANTTEKDRMGDIVTEEAWSNGGMKNYLNNPVILAHHKYDEPIGKMIDYSISSKGLEITAEISKAAGRVYDLIKDGILKTFSIGFVVKDGDYDQARDIFTIKDLELLEVSVVSVPANQGSIFSVAKSFNDEAEYKGFLSGFQNKEKEIMTDKVEKGTQVSAVDSDIINKAVADALAKQKELDLKEKAAIEAAEAQKAELVELGKSGAERLVSEVEKRFTDESETLKGALEGLRTELKEKSAEIEAMRSSKMSFSDKAGTSAASEKDVDTAIMLSKAMGRSISDTKYGKGLIEKANVGDHLASTTGEWELEFSTRIFEDMRQNLVIEPLFTTLPMNARVMQLPINPEAGVATWVQSSEYKAATSSGTAAEQLVQDTNITAHKLATKEYLGYEEEEDSILPIMSIVREGIIRRMARSSDIALLRGAGSAADPISGLEKVANTAGAETGSIASVTAAQLQVARRDLGIYGLDPSEVVYIVSTDAYYDLLDDPDFRTVDVVGNSATILKGQVGTINGSRVIVSGEFATKGTGETAAMAVNARFFIVGNLKGMSVERDRLIVEQQNVMVASRRMGFANLTTSNSGVASLLWA